MKPFRKGRKTRNDRADAEAIASAARQGNMRLVPVKSVDQQVRLSWHRVREGYKTESLAIGNRLRGLLAEVDVIVAPSDLALRRLLGNLDAQTGLPGEFKELLRDPAGIDGKSLTALLDITWLGARKPLDMLVAITTKICNALSAKKCEIPLNSSVHCARAELAKFLAVLLAVEDCIFQCISIPFRRNGRQSFESQRRGDGCASSAVEGERL